MRSEKIREYEREYAKAWRAKNYEQYKNVRKIWRDKNRDKINATKRLLYKNDPESRAARSLAHRIWNNSESGRKYKAAWYQKNKIMVQQHSRAARRKNPGDYMFYATMSVSKRKGLQFDLTKEWIKKRLDAGVCELSGLLFKIGGHRAECREGNIPSIDRIDAKKGYTKDNCRMILWSINHALSNRGLNYFMDIFEKILRKKKPELFRGN